jgi:hypothetical protein
VPLTLNSGKCVLGLGGAQSMSRVLVLLRPLLLLLSQQPTCPNSTNWRRNSGAHARLVFYIELG